MIQKYSEIYEYVVANPIRGLLDRKRSENPCLQSSNVNIKQKQHAFDPLLLPSGNPFKCHEKVLHLQPMVPPKRFDIFSPDWGMLRRSIDAFRFFFENKYCVIWPVVQLVTSKTF